MIDIYKKYSLLEKFLDKSVSLADIGVNEVCWSYKDSMDVINYLSKNNCVVLGGDVLLKKNNKLIYTYDSWFIEQKPYETNSVKYIEKCRCESINYINEYVKTNSKYGEKFYFVIVYKEIIS